VLRLSPDGAEFAVVTGHPQVTVLVPERLRPAGTWVGVEAGDARAAGWVNLGEHPLYPAGPIVLAEVAHVSRGVRLTIEDAVEGTLTVALPPLDEIQTPLRGRVPCEALSADWTDFDERALAGLPPPDATEKLQLREGAYVPLRATPEGDVRATLRAPLTGPVERIEERGDRSRIVVDLGLVILTGWVSSSALEEAGANDDVFGLATRGFEAPEPPVWTCTRPFPLLAKIGNQEVRVGQVAPGASLEMESDDSNERTFSLEWLRPHGGAEFILPADLRSACERRP
jgi:hypothetical protein